PRISAWLVGRLSPVKEYPPHPAKREPGAHPCESLLAKPASSSRSPCAQHARFPAMPDPSSPPAGPASDAVAALHRLFAEEGDYRMEQTPTRASTLGDRRWNDRWPDLSLEAIEARHRHDREALNRLARIDREQLSPVDRLNFDLFRKEYETDVEGHAFRRF